MASRNTFRLEAVLRVRQRAFEEAQRVVARRLRAVGREQSAIEIARASIAEQVGASRAEQVAGVLDIATLRSHRTLTLFLNRHIVEVEGRIVEHERALEKERQAMVRASVAVKSLEKLKERRAARQALEQERRRVSEEGETALQLHRRSQELLIESRAGNEG